MGARASAIVSASQGQMKGSVLVEFAMILPLLIFFLFASYEFSKVLRMHQLVATTAREIARDAYRQCYGEKSFAGQSSDQSVRNSCTEDVFTQACLDQVAENAKGLRNAAIALDAPFVGDLRIALSAFQFRSVGTSGTAPAGAVVRVGYAVEDLTSQEETEEPIPGEEPHPAPEIDDSFVRYSEERINNDPNLLNFVQTNRYAIVTEVIGRYSLSTYRLVPTLDVSFDPFGGRYYYVVVH
ncbi:MAG TPA: pilus assembly protein [Oligoflexia bacterium]|nr:pilus assembly protein [Oligoflexia bacterium]